MPKKRRRKADLLEGRRHPPFGATAAQGKLNERERHYKNQIHTLEQRLESMAREIDKQDNEIGQLERRLVYAEPTTAQRAAMRELCQMPISAAIEAGMFGPLCELARWSLLLDGKVTKGESGANVIEWAARLPKIDRDKQNRAEAAQVFASDGKVSKLVGKYQVRAWGAGERAKEHRGEERR
jgi:hypothetical protein